MWTWKWPWNDRPQGYYEHERSLEEMVLWLEEEEPDWTIFVVGRKIKAVAHDIDTEADPILTIEFIENFRY